MHDQSLPIGDRADTDSAVAPQDRRRAIVLRLADGKFFRGWRPRAAGGGMISVERLARAQFFPPGSKALEQAREKLRRNGIDAEPEEAIIVIGGTPAV